MESDPDWVEKLLIQVADATSGISKTASTAVALDFIYPPRKFQVVGSKQRSLIASKDTTTKNILTLRATCLTNPTELDFTNCDLKIEAEIPGQERHRNWFCAT